MTNAIQQQKWTVSRLKFDKCTVTAWVLSVVGSTALSASFLWHFPDVLNLAKPASDPPVMAVVTISFVLFVSLVFLLRSLVALNGISATRFIRRELLSIAVVAGIAVTFVFAMQTFANRGFSIAQESWIDSIAGEIHPSEMKRVRVKGRSINVVPLYIGSTQSTEKITDKRELTLPWKFRLHSRPLAVYVSQVHGLAEVDQGKVNLRITPYRGETGPGNSKELRLDFSSGLQRKVVTLERGIRKVEIQAFSDTEYGDGGVYIELGVSALRTKIDRAIFILDTLSIIILLFILVSIARHYNRKDPVESQQETINGNENSSVISFVRTWAVFLGFALLGMGVFLGISSIFGAKYVATEQTIYYSDQANYWNKVVAETKFIQSKFEKDGALDLAKKAAGRWSYSIATSDYNVLPVLPLLSWSLAGGTSREVYVLSIINVYLALAAASLIFFVIVTNRARARDHPLIIIGVPLTVLLLCPPSWEPILRGLPDVGVLAFNFAALGIYLARPLNELRPRHLYAIGLLLAFAILFRRWQAYWVVAFFTAVMLDAILYVVSRWRPTLTDLFIAVRPVLVIGGVLALSLLTLAFPFFHNAMTTDYAEIYSAWRTTDSGLVQFLRLVDVTGVALLVWMFVSLAFLLAERETRRIGIFLGASFLVVFIHFTSVQDLSRQHYYLVLSSTTAATALFLVQTMKRSRRAVASLIATAFILTGVASSATTFWPRFETIQQGLAPLVPVRTTYPLVRHDMKELSRLFSTIEQEANLIGGKFGLYVLPTEGVLTHSHFRHSAKAALLDEKSVDLSDHVLNASHVDKRDGFPVELLNADIVVVSKKSREWGQAVVDVPAQSFLDETDIGRAFKRLDTVFQLDNGAETYVFVKWRSIQRADTDELSRRLRERYPDDPNIYRAPRES